VIYGGQTEFPQVFDDVWWIDFTGYSALTSEVTWVRQATKSMCFPFSCSVKRVLIWSSTRAPRQSSWPNYDNLCCRWYGQIIVVAPCAASSSSVSFQAPKFTFGAGSKAPVSFSRVPPYWTLLRMIRYCDVGFLRETSVCSWVWQQPSTFGSYVISNIGASLAWPGRGLNRIPPLTAQQWCCQDRFFTISLGQLEIQITPRTRSARSSFMPSFTVTLSALDLFAADIYFHWNPHPVRGQHRGRQSILFDRRDSPLPRH
jgi:hypothetical protein